MKHEKTVPLPTALLLLVLLLALAGVAADKPGIPKADKTKAAAVPKPTLTESIDLGGGVKMEFVLIPAGSFMMGSATRHKGHKVTLTKPFYLGKFEVTQEQWEEVMGSNPSNFKGPKLPVENVSWNDCQNFLTKLQEKTGRKFALPTEAQWEYACRAGTTTRYSFGDNYASLGEYAWFSGNSGSRTHPVGLKKPNPWGLYDMHGNVYEWCADWLAEYPCGEAINPQGSTSGSFRVLRGGSWLSVSVSDIPNFFHSNVRNSNNPVIRNSIYGFRCVVRVVSSPSP